MLEQLPMEVQDERDAQLLIAIESHEPVDGVAVPGELLLVAVAEPRRPLGDLPRPLGLDGDPFDRVRRRDRRDSGVLRELPQDLRNLVGEEFLATSAGVDASEDRAELARLAGKRRVEVDEAPASC